MKHQRQIDQRREMIFNVACVLLSVIGLAALGVTFFLLTTPSLPVIIK